VLNRVILIGRLTRDPELRFTQGGTPVVNFTIAVDRSFTNQQGERGADFIRIVAWNKLAETVANYLNKGRLVAVDGRLQVRSYEDREGQKRQSYEVVAETVRFLDRAGATSGSEPKDDVDFLSEDDLSFLDQE